jgi:membrane-associated phospholipid phosphatase
MAGAVQRLARDLVSVFAPRCLPWHLLAMGLTVILVTSGVDGWVAATAHGTQIRRLGFSAGRIGFWMPIAAPLAMLALGGLRRDRRLRTSAWHVAESEVLALGICAAYKALTGRPGPTSVHDGAFDAVSRVFRFGFMRGGVFWGWPSSHVMTAFAGAVALAMLYRRHRGLVWPTAAYAAFMAAGVSISFHWFSDVVAGAIIGTVIGVVVAAGVEANESALAGRTPRLAPDRYAPLSRGRS